MTDLTAPEHEHTEAVIVAAQWLAEQHQPPQPIVTVLRQRFDLTAVQACEASAMAQRFRTYRRAHA